MFNALLGPIGVIRSGLNQIAIAKKAPTNRNSPTSDDNINDAARDVIRAIYHLALTIIASAALYGSTYAGSTATLATAFTFVVISIPASLVTTGTLLAGYGCFYAYSNIALLTLGTAGEIALTIGTGCVLVRTYEKYSWLKVGFGELPVGLGDHFLLPNIISSWKPSLLPVAVK